MPTIDKDEDDNKIVTIPGLAEELHKVKKNLDIIKQERTAGKSSFNISVAEGFTDHANGTTMANTLANTMATLPRAGDTKMTKIMDLEDYLKMELPRNRFEFEEMTKQWNPERKRPSPEFLAINRKNKKLTSEYLVTKDGAENVYSPKRHLIESKITRHMTIMAPRKGFGRTPTKMPPICTID